MRALEQAFFAAARVGESAGFESEEFAFEQRVRERGAVQFDERHGCARAGVVDGFGEHSFAGAAFALNKDGGVVGLGGFAGDFEHAASVGIFGDDASEVVASLGLLDVVADAHAEGEHFAGTMEGGDHVGEVEGLDEVVVGAELHGFDGAIDHVVGAHHEDDGGGRGLFHLAQDVDAVHAGHDDVEEGEVGLLVLENADGIFAGVGGEDVEALVAQSAGDGAEG